MQSINLVVNSVFPVPDAALAALRGLDSRLRVTLVGDEQRSFLRKGGADDPAPAAQALRETLAEAEIMFSAFDTPPDLLVRAPRLKWLHTMAAGVERLVAAGFLERPDIAITSGQGPTATPIAEYILMTMLMLAKGAPAYIRNQDERRWRRAPGGEINGKTLGIVGLGSIGGEAARLAKGFGCRVIATRRSVQETQANVAGVDLLLPARDLPRLLAESDFVALCAPATAETAALIDAEALRRMKPTAYLINIARGSLVDEAALVAAIKAGEIAGAALDVFQPEPLPPASELWSLPQVIITPHSSSVSERFVERAWALFSENVGHYLRGEPLRNLVAAERGY